VLRRPAAWSVQCPTRSVIDALRRQPPASVRRGSGSRTGGGSPGRRAGYRSACEDAGPVANAEFSLIGAGEELFQSGRLQCHFGGFWVLPRNRSCVLPEQACQGLIGWQILLRRVHGRYARMVNARKLRSGHVLRNRMDSRAVSPSHLHQKEPGDRPRHSAVG
jgi:hypothetical protein